MDTIVETRDLAKRYGDVQAPDRRDARWGRAGPQGPPPRPGAFGRRASTPEDRASLHARSGRADEDTPSDAHAEMAIRTRGLTRRFGANEAVRSLDLDVRSGEIFGLLGHNGSGKTTTVRLLNGVLAPNEGRVRVLGLDPVRDGTRLRRRTGVSTETPSLDERLTGRQGLRFFADLYGVPRHRVTGVVEDLLDRFGLVEAGDRLIGAYSKGMRQRLALARALLHDPDVLFLDEPTGGLDPVATREVEQVIRRLARDDGKTVLLCTHDLAQAQALCDRVAVLERGKLIALGRRDELARRYGGTLRLHLALDPTDKPSALAALSDDLRFAEADLEDEGVRVDVPDREAVPDLIALLVRAGVRLYGATLEEPSLEDVYFALHERSERDEAP